MEQNFSPWEARCTLPWDPGSHRVPAPWGTRVLLGLWIPGGVLAPIKGGRRCWPWRWPAEGWESWGGLPAPGGPPKSDLRRN